MINKKNKHKFATLKKIYTLLYLLLFLFACSSTTFKVKLKNETIEYSDAEVDVCQIIIKIDERSIKDHNRDANKISENGYDVKCPTTNVRKLGKQETTILINGVDVTINFKVEDTTAPVITVKKDILEVEKNNEYFDVKNMINVEDNYDSNPIVTFTGNYDVNVPGEYEIKITAKDTNKNVSKKVVKIVVGDKEIEVVEKQTIVNNPTLPNQSESGSHPENGSNGNSAISPPNSPSSLAPKRFMFADGYTMPTGSNSAFAACTSYMGSNTGSCTPIPDTQVTGLYIGVEYLP